MDPLKNIGIPSFQDGTVYSSTAGPSGVMSLNEFTEKEDESKAKDALKVCGLSDREIKIYKDYEEGIMDSKHKLVEKSALSALLEDIKNRVENPMSSVSSEGNKESIDVDSTLVHPMNNIKDLSQELFGHMDVDSLPSVTKRLKLMRRLRRKADKEIPVPCLDRITTSKEEKPTHSYNDFITKITQSTITPCRKPTSKWDMKNIPEIQPNKVPHTKKKPGTVKGCSRPSLYTIRNNKIVRVENRQGNTLETSDIDTPRNVAEKMLLEGTKLDLDKIKQDPKFKDYEMGQPSMNLFIKNISPKVEVNDLRSLFDSTDDILDVRLMTGRMKGQAFVNYKTISAASEALNSLNGTFLKGKPIVIQFSKNK